MANYCDETDIEENLKGVIISSSTEITSTSLSKIITQESATIDVYLQQRYSLPIAGTSALEFLKKICIALVVYRVTNILQPKEIRPIPNENAEQDISHYSAYKDAMRLLKALLDGTITLPDETESSKVNFSSTAVNDCDKSTFEYHETQW